MHQIRSTARRRRRLVGLIAAVASIGLGAGLSDGSASAAPVPRAVPGDRYSPAVVALASEALLARAAYVTNGDAESFHTFERSLREAAAGVAVEFAADPAVVTAAWSRAGLDNQTAVLSALTQLGNDYQYASSDPAVGFDCSGLTSFAWRQAGVELPPQSGSQIDVSVPVDAGSAAAGDLVQYPGHVMMYLGFDRAMVHAANEASNVELSQLPDRNLSWADPSA
ncbi:MAG: C40 family peptidase [Desertimonas sp.]